MFFDLVLENFITFLVGNLFLEPDLQELRLYFVAFSIRWFVWEFLYEKKVF